MGQTADKLNYFLQTKSLIKQAIIDKGVDVSESDTFRSYAEKIGQISGGPSIDNGNIFTGWTMPITFDKDSEEDRTFVYKSNTHDITLTFGSYPIIESITGNGTKEVTVVIADAGYGKLHYPFTITCVDSEGESTVFNGVWFNYEELQTGYCFAIAKRELVGYEGQANYDFIESQSLPLFTSEQSTWNGICAPKLVSFRFGKWTGSIRDYFLAYCYSFNQPLTIPEGCECVGSNFMAVCRSFNQPIILPTTFYQTGSYFMVSCTSFNQNIEFKGNIYLDSYFLQTCYAFNANIIFDGNVNSVGNYFMQNCYAFNKPLRIPGNITSLGNYFMPACYAFNSEIELPSTLTSIPSYFMRNCHAFNKPLTLPESITAIGDYFMQNCDAFNSKIKLPQYLSTIGTYFLYGCSGFNKQLDLPDKELVSIGQRFMYANQSYSGHITVPSTVTSIGTYFMYLCVSFMDLTYDAKVCPTDDYSLSESSGSGSGPYGTGIFVNGDNVNELLENLPDRTSTPYRKLIKY